MKDSGCCAFLLRLAIRQPKKGVIFLKGIDEVWGGFFLPGKEKT